MDVQLRAYADRDFDFARGLYFETMRWAIERHFGWDETNQQASFAGWFEPKEVTHVIRQLFSQAEQQSQAVTLAVMKINRARDL